MTSSVDKKFPASKGIYPTHNPHIKGVCGYGFCRCDFLVVAQDDFGLFFLCVRETRGQRMKIDGHKVAVREFLTLTSYYGLR